MTARDKLVERACRQAELCDHGRRCSCSDVRDPGRPARDDDRKYPDEEVREASPQ